MTSRPNIYDILKVVAITAMVIDHIWLFIFPEIQVLRAIGRFAFIPFLGLVWFSKSYKRRNDLLIQAGIVQWCFILMGLISGYVDRFTINILWSIIIWRIVVSGISSQKIHIKYIILWLFLFTSLLYSTLLTNIFEYGIHAITIIIRWHIASQESKKPIHIIIKTMTLILFTIVFSRYTYNTFPRTATNYSIAAIMIALSIRGIYKVSRTNRTIHSTAKIKHILLRIAQKSLYIYSIHIVILTTFNIIRYFFS